jgi:hypothetical protein
MTLSLTGLLVFLLVRSTSEFNFTRVSGYLMVLLLTLFVTAYCYSSCVVINCYYDRSTPQIHEAKVLGKRISSGKTTTYYLTLTAWGPRTEAEDVTVSEDQYEQIAVGSPVKVYQMKGLLDVPWFFVDGD